MRLVSLLNNKVDMTEAQEEVYRNQPVEVMAVLSQGQYQMIRTGAAEIEIPYGVEMQNKAGSRTLLFSCENRDVAEELMDGLDNSGIAWDEEDDQNIDLSDIIGEQIRPDMTGFSVSGVFTEQGQN